MSSSVLIVEELLAQLRRNYGRKEGDKIKERVRMEGAKIMQQAIKRYSYWSSYLKHALETM
ncbi:hypothetical protein P7H20_10405 [Paenibacillus larvae]|nr:hypothetical protein [Paenibacillus larvae]MDT2275164.1 hypothetical protein [Paenibacillus larvae]